MNMFMFTIFALDLFFKGYQVTVLDVSLKINNYTKEIPLNHNISNMKIINLLPYVIKLDKLLHDTGRLIYLAKSFGILHDAD